MAKTNQTVTKRAPRGPYGPRKPKAEAATVKATIQPDFSETIKVLLNTRKEAKNAIAFNRRKLAECDAAIERLSNT